MPFADHYRLTASGVFQEADTPPREAFSFRVNLSRPSNFSDQGGVAADMAADTVALFGRATSHIASIARLMTVKLAPIGADGLYTGDPTVVEVDQRGASTTLILNPPQVSLAVTLQSDRRGATGRGRFFLPAPDIPVNAQLVIADAARNDVATSVAQWLNDLNNKSGLDVAASRVTIASTKGYNSDVTSVRVGNVLDTIRSRRTSVEETYSTPLTVS